MEDMETQVVEDNSSAAAAVDVKDLECSKDATTREVVVEKSDGMENSGMSEDSPLRSWGSTSTVSEGAFDENKDILSLCVETENKDQEIEDDSGKDSGQGSPSPCISLMDSNSNRGSPESFKLTCDEDCQNEINIEDSDDKDAKECGKKLSELLARQIEEKAQEDKKLSVLIMEDSAKESVNMEDDERSAHVKLEGPFLLNSVIFSDTPVDMYFSCKGGKIGAHRLVLAASSQFVSGLFEDVPPGDPAVIILPDVSGKIVETVLSFIYTGQMTFPEMLRDEVQSLMGMLMIGENARFTMSKVKVKPKCINLLSSPGLPAAAMPQSVSDSKQCDSKTKTTASEKKCNSDTDSEDDMFYPEKKPKPDPNEPKKIPGIGCVLQTHELRCAFCEETRSKREQLCTHVQNVHNMQYIENEVSAEEKKELLYCAYCNKMYETLSLVQQCLKDHQQYRCYICLGVFPIAGFLNHTSEAHSVNTVFGPVSQCRWCNLSLELAGTGLAMSRHVIAKHFRIPPRGKNPEEKKPLAPIFTLMKKHSSPKTVSAPLSVKNKRSKQDLQAVLSSRATKRPRLDENGQPIYYSKKTGVPVGSRTVAPDPFGTRKPTLDPSTKFQVGVQKINREEFASKFVSNDVLLKLPEIHVHAVPLTPEEINNFLNGNNKKRPDLSHEPRNKEVAEEEISEPLLGNPPRPLKTNVEPSDVRVPSSPRQCVEAIAKYLQSTVESLEITKQH